MAEADEPSYVVLSRRIEWRNAEGASYYTVPCDEHPDDSDDTCSCEGKPEIRQETWWAVRIVVRSTHANTVVTGSSRISAEEAELDAVSNYSATALLASKIDQ